MSGFAAASGNVCAIMDQHDVCSTDCTLGISRSHRGGNCQQVSVSWRVPGVGTKADARDGFTQAGGKPFCAGGRGDPSGGTVQSPGTAFPPQRDRRALRRRGEPPAMPICAAAGGWCQCHEGLRSGRRRVHSEVLENEFLAIKLDGNEPLPRPVVSYSQRDGRGV